MDGGTDSLLTDLRQTFNKKVPGGLTETADSRLQRTLQHYVKEVERVQGSAGQEQTQDILRMTYDSMAAWFRRNLNQIMVQAPAPAPAPVEEKFDSEMDPATVFATIKAARAAASPLSPVAAVPSRMPDLPKVDFKPVSPNTYLQPKDIITPQQDVVKYREVEYNLVMNSKDRDWMNSTNQNRYNFSIQFNTNFRPKGLGIQGMVQGRLRNIIRLEFVKAILPVEGLSVVVPRDCSASIVTPQATFQSVLSLPSINVLVDELQGNNFGTTNSIDNSLAICQYDATWRSDGLYHKPNTSRGYALFIPKFMKAQRIYTPAPLANLQSLSFRLQDPEDKLLSDQPDSASVRRIAFSADVFGSCYSDPSGGDSNYIFVNTKNWFPLWSFSQLDRILINGIPFESGSDLDGGKAFVQWLQGTGAHTLVGVAHTSNSADPLIVDDGCNTVGYADWIVIRNRFADPKTGSTTLDYFTGSQGGDLQLAKDLATYPIDYVSGAMLNLSRQVQLTVRVITREHDLTSNVRADNI